MNNKHVTQELMWSTPIWRTQLWDFMRSETRTTFNEHMTTWMKSQRDKHKSVFKSNRGGWQSDLQKPEGEFEPLVNEIKQFCKSLPLNISEVSVEQLWFNINKKNDWNIIHNHGSHYHLSGTYYVRVPENSGRIVFRDPRPGQLLNNFMMERFDNNELYYKDIMEGLLMIWPSYVDHFVEPSQTNEERISISFDIIAK